MLQTFFKIVILQQKSQPTCQSVICEEGIETTKCLKDIFAALLFFFCMELCRCLSAVCSNLKQFGS